jgi:hypothetical protein
MITVVNASFYGGDKEIKSIVNQPLFKGVEYVLYTNKPEVVKGTNWKAVQTEPVNNNPRLGARFIKSSIHSFHPKSEYWLWIDSNMKIEKDPNILIKKYLANHDICVMPHPERNNWYEEASIVVQGRDSVDNIQRAIDKYYGEGFPPTTLFETGCLLRRNTKVIQKFNNTWWKEIQENSIRDQLSFPYAAWRHGIAVNTFPGTNSVNALRFKIKKYLPQWNEIIRDWN